MLSSLLALLPLTFVQGAGGSSLVTFADDTFDDADWQTSAIVMGPGSPVGTGLQVQTGNPAPARRVAHSFVAAVGATTLWLEHSMIAAVYDPALEGAIGQVSFSIDYDGTGALQRVLASVRQGNRLYVNGNTNWLTTFAPAWATIGSPGIGQDDFVEQLPDGSFGHASHPDFSASGTPITFGFQTGNTHGSARTLTVDYDNFLVVVNGVQSAVAVRLGSPPNPDALRPGATGGPVLGTTWDPFLDHASFLPAATMDFAVYSRFPGAFLTSYGMLLCNQIEEGQMVPAGQPFSFPVASDPSLAGLTYCVQGASMDPVQGILLTNALDVTIGSF